MSINKIVLEPDGLVVGDNQLITQGGGVSVGKNLVVQGNTYSGNVTSSVINANIIYANQIVFPGQTGNTSTITSATLLEKQYTKVGVLAPYQDQANRFYPSTSIVISSINTRVGTPTFGGSLTLSVCKNAVPVANITVQASQYSATEYLTPIQATAGDYFNININSVGNIVPGADLYVTFKYYRV
jgi:hypothetical protein